MDVCGAQYKTRLVDTTGKLRLKNGNGPIKGLVSLIYGRNDEIFEIEDPKIEINAKIDLGYLIVQRSHLESFARLPCSIAQVVNI